MRNKSRNRQLVAILSLTLLLFACGDTKSIQDLRAYLAKLKETAQKQQKNVVIPPLKLPIGIVYQANVLRPPFMDESAFMGGVKKVVTNPLQAFSLTMLKFIGTLSSGTAMTAFILAPDNKIYQVKAGDLLGDHDGKVVNIFQDRLEVMEETTDNNGRISQRVITLQLKEQSE